MKIRIPTLGLAVVIIVGTLGCVRETAKEELEDISRQAQMNTIATTIYYTGSDDDYDYFYLDIPLGRNDACKVLRSENSVMNRMPVTRERATWRIFSPVPIISMTNAIVIQTATNTLIIVPGMKIQEKRTSEPPAVPYSEPAPQPPQG